MRGSMQSRLVEDDPKGDLLGEGWIEDLVCLRRSRLKRECMEYGLSIVLARGYIERDSIIELPDERLLRITELRKGLSSKKEKVEKLKGPALALVRVAGIGWEPRPEDYVPFVGLITIRIYRSSEPPPKRGSSIVSRGLARSLGILRPMLAKLLAGTRRAR